MKYPTLETERLELQPILLEHAPALFEIFSDEETIQYVPIPKHHAIADTTAYLEKLMANNEAEKASVWSVYSKEENRVFGNLGLYAEDPANHSASLGVIIHKDFWRKGYVVEALQKVIDYSFSTKDLVRIEARVDSNNPASYKMLEKLGMVYEGTLRKDCFLKGSQRSTKIYSILKEEWMSRLVK
ncbi:GNAT family N-acetyltransferase [Brevibacillus ginsengisoli]|uniref:GNAT family N-acetyltransferase n=1 Tax=Brevibacillus ginsengisoli TaxID=363854 RepID=UPI003CFB489A